MNLTKYYSIRCNAKIQLVNIKIDLFCWKKQILKNIAVTLGCHGNVNVDVVLTRTLKCFQLILGKVLIV